MNMHSKTATPVLLTLLISFPLWIHAAELKPETILANMRAAYTNLTSYSDSGTLDTTVKAGIPGYVLKKPFTITFKKPDLIKIEWTSSFGGMKDPHVLWNGKPGTFTHKKLLNQTRKDQSLEHAIRSWTGVSGGSVRNVPCMLISVMKEPQFSDLADLKNEGIEAVGKTDCHKVSGTRRDQPVTLWIGKDDFLLRKLTASTQFGDIVETHENIKINADIKDAAASFVPPKDAEQVERFSYKKLKKRK